MLVWQSSCATACVSTFDMTRKTWLYLSIFLKFGWTQPLKGKDCSFVWICSLCTPAVKVQEWVSLLVTCCYSKLPASYLDLKLQLRCCHGLLQWRHNTTLWPLLPLCQPPSNSPDRRACRLLPHGSWVLALPWASCLSAWQTAWLTDWLADCGLRRLRQPAGVESSGSGVLKAAGCCCAIELACWSTVLPVSGVEAIVCALDFVAWGWICYSVY